MRKLLLLCLTLAVLALFGRAGPMAPAADEVPVIMTAAAPPALDPMDAPRATALAAQVENVLKSFNDDANGAIDNRTATGQEVLKLGSDAKPATAHPLLC